MCLCVHMHVLYNYMRTEIWKDTYEASNASCTFLHNYILYTCLSKLQIIKEPQHFSNGQF